MDDYMNVKIDREDALDALARRVEFWNDDPDVVMLFTEYYEAMIYEGCFDGAEFDVKSIVDNDYVNNLSYGTREEMRIEFGDDFEERIVAESGDLVLLCAY